MDSFAYWTNYVLTIILGLVFLSIWTRVIYNGIYQKKYSLVIRALNSVLSFTVWLSLIFIQVLMPQNAKVYSTTLFIGYFSLVFSLISLWRFVLYQSSNQLKELLKDYLYRRILIGVSTIYSVIYLFATGMVTTKPENFSQPGIRITNNYGPITMWRNIEFFFPSRSLFGTISVGTFLIMITVTGLTGIGLTLLFYRWKKGKKDLKAIGPTAGVSLMIPLVSLSCCSLPLFYPLFVLFIGTATANSVSSLLMDWTGVLFNLIQITILSFLAIAVGSITKQIPNDE